MVHSFFNRFLKGEPLSPSGSVRVETCDARMRGEFSHTLFLDECTMETAGDVKAVAKNPAGEATSEAKLEITGNNQEIRDEY